MKISNDNKLRLTLRAICKYAKHIGLELEQLHDMLDEEWDKA